MYLCIYIKLVKSQLSQLVSIFEPFSREFCLQNDQNLMSGFLCHVI